MLEIAIVGAGPYGLSIAAYFRHQGIPFRIFGRPMDSWLKHMPKGMQLKSDGFASDLFDPERAFTLRKFCAERGIEYADTGIPVRGETFSAYGLAFRDRMVPELEEKMVAGIDAIPGGFSLRLEDGETFQARRVALAIGLTHFEFVPEILAQLPAELCTHSSRQNEVDVFRGKSVIVVGGGSSALDWAGLLREAGVDVQMVSRRKELQFHSKPTGKPRTLWQRIRRPQSSLGPGVSSKFYAEAPMVFHCLPSGLRADIVRTALGPSGGWFIRDKVIGKLPVHLGSTVRKAEAQNGRVHLTIETADGSRRELVADRVIAATGYKVDLGRLRFLSSEIRSKIKLLNGSPTLSTSFESSVPGLYFAGMASANSFGPVMRFAVGAGFTARTICGAIEKSVATEPVMVPVASAATSAK
jgi:thioredoxin reductase